MKLTELYNMTMKEVIEQCEIIDQKIHTNDDGDIMAIEMKYKPKNIDNTRGPEIPTFMRDIK